MRPLRLALAAALTPGVLATLPVSQLAHPDMPAQRSGSVAASPQALQYLTRQPSLLGVAQVGVQLGDYAFALTRWGPQTMAPLEPLLPYL